MTKAYCSICGANWEGPDAIANGIAHREVHGVKPRVSYKQPTAGQRQGPDPSEPSEPGRRARKVPYEQQRDRIVAILAEGPLNTRELAERMGSNRKALLKMLVRARDDGAIAETVKNPKPTVWSLP